MAFLDRVFDLIMKIYLFMAKIFLLAMVVIIGIQVFFRYVLNQSISWSEEISMLLMVMFGFISIAIGVQKGLHLNISLFYDRFPPRMQKICDKIVDSTVMGVGFVMVIYGVRLIGSTMHAPMPATGLPAATLYCIVPLTGLLVFYYSFSDLIGHHHRKEQKEGLIV
jgi:TRAP-type C4-dicarboxylate transport system permease small subunit